VKKPFFSVIPIKKGRFDAKVPVYFSSQQSPIEIRVKAEVAFIDPYTNPQCPSFDEMAMATSDQFKATFEVLDSQTGSPIHKAQIRVIDRGELIAQIKTNRQGKSEGVLPISYYYMLAQAPGYALADSASYINRRNNFFRFYLEPLAEPLLDPLANNTLPTEVEEFSTPEPKSEQDTTPLEEEPDIIIVIGEENQEETLPKPPNPPTPPAKEEPDANPDFSTKAFKPNNIVFLVDVSSSMGGKGKMELLQASMIELLDLLRPVDQVTIITYATRVNVVLPTTSAVDKEEIKTIIKDLEARGKTAGAKGVKKAFKSASVERIEGGNNQVIIASDGAFKMEDNPVIEKTVRKYQRKAIDLSVIGIKGSKSAKTQLSKLAESGNGAYIEVESYDQATQALVKEIKAKSRIK